ncbi:hypothetical protein [Clostridium luticellarii]|jgi:hypothetical protein|nr:hypothetical protein [Clostridium luticellarii]
MDRCTSKKLGTVESIYFGCNGQLSAKDIINRAGRWRLDDNGELYDEDIGTTYKDIDMLTPLEMKQFLKNI